MQLVDHIFRAYDIRGIYPSEVNAETAYAVANQFVGFLGEPTNVLVVHDARVSSPELTDAVTRGLSDAGVTALDGGLGPTDLFYYGCAILNCPGIMVTASHNPPEYGGFKIVRQMPYALSFEEGIAELRRRIHEEDPVRRPGGRTEGVDLEGGFIEYMVRTIGKFSMDRQAIVDTGNGASGPLMVKLRDAFGLRCEVMFAEPDGRFPNRGPDPTQAENLAPLAARVRETAAAIGIALDGDGDRAVVVDSGGEPVSGDFVAALLAQNALKRQPGSRVISDVRCSRAVRDTILAHGGTPVTGRVGHVYMKSRLAKEHAAFAGELSGHYYFPEFFGADSGLMAALYMIAMAAELGPKWEQELERLRHTYHISGEINFRVENARQKIESLRSRYAQAAITELD
ncbi:MAG: phosphomannomutase/phosphoglucomutase, partial [Chloroflexi bacterium]|nr:phosphomannomutase/phosphoglucomutase [Chloroflexota bacterium]